MCIEEQLERRAAACSHMWDRKCIGLEGEEANTHACTCQYPHKTWWVPSNQATAPVRPQHWVSGHGALGRRTLTKRTTGRR